MYISGTTFRTKISIPSLFLLMKLKLIPKKLWKLINFFILFSFIFLFFQYTPLVEKSNEGLVHHVILYECVSTSPTLGKHTKLAGAHCYSPTMPREWESCLQPVLAWARGSKGESRRNFFDKSAFTLQPDAVSSFIFRQ